MLTKSYSSHHLIFEIQLGDIYLVIMYKEEIIRKIEAEMIEQCLEYTKSLVDNIYMNVVKEEQSRQIVFFKKRIGFII